MRAKKRVFNDVTTEDKDVLKNDVPSLGDLLPRDWCVKPTNNNNTNNNNNACGADPASPAPPALLQLDERLLHEAPAMSAAAETTPTRQTPTRSTTVPAMSAAAETTPTRQTTPRSRRMGVVVNASGGGGVHGSGRRASSSTQKCIKFNQDPNAKNQTILKYFSKKN